MTWRRPVSRGALLVMEALWAYAVVIFFVSFVASGNHPTLLAVAAVVFVSFSISRLLQASDLSLGLIRIWGVGLSLLLFYCIVRVEFFGDWRFWDFSFADDLFNRTEATLRDKATAVIAIPLMWAFWMRGVMRGQQHIEFDSVLGSFATGLVVIAIVEVFAAALDMPETVRLLPIPFITIGLLAISLAHAGRAEDEFGRSFTPTWALAVAGAIAVIAAVALLFIIIDFHQAFELLADGGKAVGYVFAKGFYYITYPFVWLVEQFSNALRWVFEKVYGGTRNQQPQQPPEDQNQEQNQQTKPLPAWVSFTVRAIVAGSLISLILILTALMFSRFRKRRLDGEIKESTYQEGRLAADLGDLLSSLLGRLRPNFHFGGDDLDPARRLYFDLLAAGTQRGVERRSPETPQELAPRLDQAFAAETPGRITGTFHDVRYGGLPPPTEDVERLRKELDEIRNQDTKR